MIGAKYAVQFRRKREGKTDYRRRFRLLKSNLPRFVFRKSNENVWVQIAIASPMGDKILASAHSRRLLHLGYKAHRSNLPAAYLVGYLAGKEALNKGINEAILDIGLMPSIKGSLIYSCVKGALDAGFKIKVANDVLPSEDRLSGKHIVDFAKLLGNKKESFFSRCFENDFDPEKIFEHFKIIKEKCQKN